MPERQFITPISGIQVFDSFEGSAHILTFGRVERPKNLKCVRCESIDLRTKATVNRRLKHGVWGGRIVWLDLKIPKMLCRVCGRHFMLPIPGVLPRRRSSEQFRKEVFHQHQGGFTQLQLSRTHQISSSTVERWYQGYVAYRVKELEGRSVPIVLGIDEHFFSKKQGYATTLGTSSTYPVLFWTLNSCGV
jgi:transposase